MAFKLPRLDIRVAIVDPKSGRPTTAFQRFLNVDFGGALELQEVAQSDQLDRIERSLRAISHADGLFLTAEADGATAKISITAHTRNYLDLVVSVNAGTITGLAYGQTFSVFYDDAARAGGAVTYQATTTPSEAVTSAANPNRQLVGVVTTPATAGDPPTDGGSTTPPGYPGNYEYQIIP